MTRTPIRDSDREQVAEFIDRHWGSPLVVTRGRQIYPHKESGLIDWRDGEIVGLLTYRVEADEMEILSLNATLEGQGIGTSLMLSAIEAARKDGCGRVTLVTTNDLMRAIGFYQRLGFRIVGVNVGAVDKAREIKPQIPETGERGIPIHDEIVMQLTIKPYLGECI